MIVGNERGGLSDTRRLPPDSTTPIRGAALEQAVKVFPNPVEEWLTIQVDAEGLKQLWLFNASLPTGGSTEMGWGEYRLDVSTLPAGFILFCEGLGRRRNSRAKGIRLGFKINRRKGDLLPPFLHLPASYSSTQPAKSSKRHTAGRSLYSGGSARRRC